MSQEDRILEWLEQGNTICPLEAFTRFGTLALHSRIACLRERGLNISCTLIKTPGGKKVGEYKLERIAYG